MKKTERFQVYYIPHNFVDSGKALGGMVSLRNLVEGGAIAILPALLIIRFCPGGFDVKAALVLLVCFPLLIFGCVGLNGDSLSEFFLYYIRFCRKKRIIQYNPRIKIEAVPYSDGMKSELPKERLIRMFGSLIGKKGFGETEDDMELENESDQFFDDDVGILIDAPITWQQRLQEWYHNLLASFTKKKKTPQREYAEYSVEPKNYLEYIPNRETEDDE